MTWTRAHFRSRRGLAGGLLCLALQPVPCQCPRDQKPLAAPNLPPAKKPLPPLPTGMPDWLDGKLLNGRRFLEHSLPLTYENMKPLFDELEIGEECHAMVEEALVTGQAAALETATYTSLLSAMQDPAATTARRERLSLYEKAPFNYSTLGSRYRYIEMVVSRTHSLHDWLLQVLIDEKLNWRQKEQKIQDGASRYFGSGASISGLPMNMLALDNQPYSRTFRARYPRTAALIWGFHWLENASFDLLYGKTPAQQKAAYAALGVHYRRVELLRTGRAAMPMFAEISPAFAARFPALANLFDNFHMLLDLVSDVIASDGMTPEQRDIQLRRAVWLLVKEGHAGEKPGGFRVNDSLHDHRFLKGMPGMGRSVNVSPELQLMETVGLGWMRFGTCHHCSLALTAGEEGWRGCRVTADGWTMRVRCPLCARDLAAETRGGAILHLATEDPQRCLVLISDEQGNLTTEMPAAVFLEQEQSHLRCSEWSRAFTSRQAFVAFTRTRPAWKGAALITLQQWAQRRGRKPDTYVKLRRDAAAAKGGKAASGPAVATPRR